MYDYFLFVKQTVHTIVGNSYNQKYIHEVKANMIGFTLQETITVNADVLNKLSYRMILPQWILHLSQSKFPYQKGKLKGQSRG